MDSGIDTSGLHFWAVVVVVIGPVLFIAFGLGRIKALRPADQVTPREPRPGYLWGMAAGAVAAFALPELLEWAGAPAWARPVSLLVLLAVPLVINPLLRKGNWFAVGMPFGILTGWLLLPILAVLLGAATGL